MGKTIESYSIELSKSVSWYRLFSTDSIESNTYAVADGVFLRVIFIKVILKKNVLYNSYFLTRMVLHTKLTQTACNYASSSVNNFSLPCDIQGICMVLAVRQFV